MSGYNLRILQRQIIAQAKRPIEARARDIVSNKVEVIKRQTLNEFDNNPITKELENKGQIFGFLGFYEEEEPTEELRNFIENNIELSGEIKTFVRGGKIIVRQTVKTPSLGAAYESVSSDGVSDWTSKSWLQLIEDGIPHFAQFIFGNFSNLDASRSKRGIQNEHVNRGGAYGAKRYVSDLFKNLRDRIKKTVK